MIKKVLISIGIVTIASAVTVGVLFFVTRTPSTPNTNTPASGKLVLDHSKDYGACRLLDASSIKTALGDTAAQLQAPENAGMTHDSYFGDGVKNIVSDSQTCVYAFAPGGNNVKALNGTNALSVKQTMYTNKDGPKALIEQIKQNPGAEVIASRGDAAFYITNTVATGPGATSSFELLVFKSNESTSYSIIQPTKSTTLTIETAKTALLRLAK